MVRRCWEEEKFNHGPSGNFFSLYRFKKIESELSRVRNVPSLILPLGRKKSQHTPAIKHLVLKINPSRRASLRSINSKIFDERRKMKRDFFPLFVRYKRVILLLSRAIVYTSGQIRRIGAADNKVTDVKRRFVSLFARRSGRKIDPHPCLPVNAGRNIKCRCKVHSGVYWQCRYIDDGHAARKSHSYYGSPCSIGRRVICGEIVDVNDFILIRQHNDVGSRTPFLR